jgi:hypothetical protein
MWFNSGILHQFAEWLQLCFGGRDVGRLDLGICPVSRSPAVSEMVD